MATTVGWKVEIGGIGALTDITSSVAGLDINQPLTFNGLAKFTANITLNNYNGAFTPNGGGTYSSRDWFATYVVISFRATSPTDPNYPAGILVETFSGIPTGFTLYDDGETSTVTLNCSDLWSVAGRTQQGSIAVIAEQSAETYIDTIGASGGYGSAFPQLGGFSTSAVTVHRGGYVRNVKSTITIDNATFGDLLNQSVMPAINGFLWPAYNYVVMPSAYANAAFLGADMTIDEAYRYTFAFDPPGSITGTDLPFTHLEQGWNIDDTINNATITSVDQPFGPIAINSTNTTATNKYGARSIAFNQAACPAGNALELTTELTNRFSTPVFAPQTVTTTASAIRASGTDSAYTALRKLLAIEDGFGQKAVITWTGAGLSTPQTANCIILGKRIRATPNDTEITLTLGAWSDYHSFILNTDKLNTDRLG